jgi:hypothetical protein
MRTYLLKLFTAVAAISVPLFANVAFAQDENETPIMTQAECEAAGYLWMPEDAWQVDGPPKCLDIANEIVVGYGVDTSPGTVVEVSPETAQAPPEAAPVEQAPTTELPATQPAQAQEGSPQYTG